MSEDLDFGETIRGMAPGQKVFNRYTLQKILGRGGMGVVWLARDDELDRDIALKFLPEIVAFDKQSIRDLKRETRRSLELTHPHIIRIYDLVQGADSAAISMEFVAGDTLASRKVDAGDGRFEVSEIQTWVQHLCEALEYAHTKAEVVHRDLKPANLMIDARGDLKIADFGIAASVSDSVSRVSVQAGSSGTPVYMSPQQMMGEPPAVTDDIYALGATLYDLLTGRPPFHSGNIMMQVMNKVPESLVARRQILETTGAEIPEAWEATILACLSKEPGERPVSAAEVWSRLSGRESASPAVATTSEGAVGSSPVSAPAVPAVTPAEGAAVAVSSGKKSMVPWPLGLVVGLGLLGTVGYWWFGVEKPAREARNVVTLKQEAERQEAMERERRQNLMAQGIDPDTGRPIRPEEGAPFAVPELAGLKMMPIPAGTFHLGSVGDVAYWSDAATPTDEPGRDQDEGPRTLVRITRPFWMGETEVTRDQWETLMPEMGRGRYIDRGGSIPIEGVTWLDAISFCQRLTEREKAAGRLPPGYVYMLPTEAQWEYACRAGTTTPYAGDVDAMAWYDANTSRPQPVKTKQPNAWGLYDMHGNVWERVWDLYGSYPGGDVSDWAGPEGLAGWRVFRGGSWQDRDRLQRSAYRGRHYIEDRRDCVGFRVALVPADPTIVPLAWDFTKIAEQRIFANLQRIHTAAEQYFSRTEETEVSWYKLLAETEGMSSADFVSIFDESYWGLSPLKKGADLQLRASRNRIFQYTPGATSLTVLAAE